MSSSGVVLSISASSTSSTRTLSSSLIAQVIKSSLTRSRETKEKTLEEVAAAFGDRVVHVDHKQVEGKATIEEI